MYVNLEKVFVIGGVTLLWDVFLCFYYITAACYVRRGGGVRIDTVPLFGIVLEVEFAVPLCVLPLVSLPPPLLLLFGGGGFCSCL